MDYDNKTCVTAMELRSVGIPIPESIPDCAWVPRRAMIPKIGEFTAGPEQGVVSITTYIEFAEPFRWVEGTFAIREDG